MEINDGDEGKGHNDWGFEVDEGLLQDQYHLEEEFERMNRERLRETEREEKQERGLKKLELEKEHEDQRILEMQREIQLLRRERDEQMAELEIERRRRKEMERRERERARSRLENEGNAEVAGILTSNPLRHSSSLSATPPLRTSSLLSTDVSRAAESRLKRSRSSNLVEVSPPTTVFCLCVVNGTITSSIILVNRTRT